MTGYRIYTAAAKRNPDWMSLKNDPAFLRSVAEFQGVSLRDVQAELNNRLNNPAQLIRAWLAEMQQAAAEAAAQQDASPWGGGV